MPDEKMYDMDFRPKTYWVYAEREQQMKATVLGDLRRHTAQEMLNGDRPYDSWYFEESITDEEKMIWTRVHPKFMGGEFLPEHKQGEVEIARVSLPYTVLDDVIVVTARWENGEIYYAVYDEHENPFIVNPKTSKEPLSMREIVGLMDSVTLPEEYAATSAIGIVLPYLEMNGSSTTLRYSPNALDGFVVVDSPFYPELNRWYEEVTSEWTLNRLYEVFLESLGMAAAGRDKKDADPVNPQLFPMDLFNRNREIGLSAQDLIELFGPPLTESWTKKVRHELNAVTEEKPKEELQRRQRRAQLRLNKKNLQNRIRGCLLGVAIGDALGAPFEHVGPRRSIWRFKESDGRIKDFQPYQGCPAGAWTDDTGMTLATCRGLLNAVKTGQTVGMALRMAFADWAGGPECRKPGKTILRAAKEGIADPGSWANGALMRISPVAIYSHLMGHERNEAAVLAYDVARLTHGHPFATFPAVESVMAILSILRGDKNIPKYLSKPAAFCWDWQKDPGYRYAEYCEYRNASIYACHPSTGIMTWQQVFNLALGLRDGEPWSKMPTFEGGMVNVLWECFDKDTTGAVAGALLGTYWGESGIPDRWKKGVEKSEEIVKIADELIDSCLAEL